MDFQVLADSVGEMCSEAAIEVANLDDRENIVYRRLRALQARVRALQELPFEFKPAVAPLEDIADTLDIAPGDVLEMVAQGNFGVLLVEGRALSPAEFGLIDHDDLAKLSLQLTFAQWWQALEAAEQARRKNAPVPMRFGMRKFAGSETAIPVGAAQGERIG